MNIYIYSVWCRFSSENFQYGLIKADSIQEAEKKIKEIYKGCLGCDVREMEFDEDNMCIIYDH